jgi:nucleotide sugar dehydrogenase
MNKLGFIYEIGIVGIGVVGSAIKNVIESFKIPIRVYDKYKKIGSGIEDLLVCNMIFICLPTPFISEVIDNEDINNYGHYDKKELNTIIYQLASLKYKGLIIIKSTVEPGTTKNLQKKYSDLLLVHNPEFLCAKTATEDFLNQKHIIIGVPLLHNKELNINISSLVDFYKTYFPNADISITTCDESEMTKITCNSFYACKIQFFTEIKLFCNQQGISYNNIKDLIIKNGWINPMHLEVPGHDGKISFGGACLPKDIQCLNSLLEKNNIDNEVIKAVVEENKKMRS